MISEIWFWICVEFAKMVDERMRKSHTEKNQGEIFKVLGREQRDEMKIQQLKQHEDTERMERAAFVNTLKGYDLLAMMFSVHEDKEKISKEKQRIAS